MDTKETKKILIGALIAFGIYYLLKKNPSWFTATYAPADKAGVGADVTASDDYYTGGGGSGYVASGVDDSVAQNGDPNSYYTENVGVPTPPYVGDTSSGDSGIPAVGAQWVGPTPQAGGGLANTNGRLPSTISELSVSNPGVATGTKRMTNILTARRVSVVR